MACLYKRKPDAKRLSIWSCFPAFRLPPIHPSENTAIAKEGPAAGYKSPYCFAYVF